MILLSIYKKGMSQKYLYPSGSNKAELHWIPYRIMERVEWRLDLRWIDYSIILSFGR